MDNSPEPYHPSQPPYQFTDQLLARTETMSRTVKNVSCNEWSLVQDASGGYYMPETILLECMAQTAGTFDEYLQKRNPPRKIFITRMKKIEFKKRPKPGDQIVITAHFIKQLDNLVNYEVQAHIHSELAAQASLYFVRN